MSGAMSGNREVYSLIELGMTYSAMLRANPQIQNSRRFLNSMDEVCAVERERSNGTQSRFALLACAVQDQAFSFLLGRAARKL